MIGWPGRWPRPTRWRLLTWALSGACFLAETLAAAPIAVRHPEGIVLGFLVLKDAGGMVQADGDLIQNARGDTVVSRLVFHFRDGSLHDETVVYRQRGTFRMLRDHQVQKGPSFPHPIDVAVEAGGRWKETSLAKE